MSVQYSKFSEQFLEALANQIEVTDTQYEIADRAYNSLGTWLQRENSSLVDRNPRIYSQGSFRLGTAIRPVSETDELDVDAVCEIDGSKSRDTQALIKKLVGKEVSSYAVAKRLTMAPPGNRCWTLRYADETKFHLDVLPAIPDGTSRRTILEQAHVEAKWAESALAITDKRHPHFAQVSTNWPHSNPKGYAKWFEMKCGSEFERRRQALFEQRLHKTFATVEQIPLSRIKTPLQRAIQILKHHRDIMCGRYSDDKPISIIITTLSAHAYDGETNLADTLYGVLAGMDRTIEDRDGIAWIGNPVDPLENFADKWEHETQKQNRFYEWLEKARDDFDNLASLRSTIDIDQQIKEQFDDRIVSKSLALLDATSLNEDAGKNAPIEIRPVPPALATAPHKQTPEWPMRIANSYSAEIVEARAGRSMWRSSKIRSNDKPLPKNCDLRFRAKTNVPKPYEIYWQVVNTGKEAEALGADGLRGDITQSQIEEGGLLRKESTEYSGSHSIECFIVKDDVVVAKSGQFIVNIV